MGKQLALVMTTFAAIDIGSNAIRLAIGRFDKRGHLSVVATRRAAVRLGAQVFRSGRMSPKLIEEGVAAFLKFEAILRAHKVSACRAVATSALRDAKNSAQFVDRVRRATGIDIEIITGDEEARLIHGAVAAAVPLQHGTSLLIDIGGGSVELTLTNRGSIIFSDSLNMGTVRLLEMVRGRKRSDRDLLRLLNQYAERIRSQIARTKKVRTITRLIGTGGNIDTFGDLRRDVLKKKNNKLVHRFELLRLMKLLQSMPIKERIEKLKLRPDRADVIMPAMALVLGIIKETKVKTVLIPHTGLRDGVLLDLYHNSKFVHPASSMQRRLDHLRSYAIELGRRYAFDETHAHHAVKLALQLYDQLRGVHQLGGEERAILEIAALLHDVGYFINSSDHHKHSEYIIRSGHFVGLSERQRNMVALIARYHRGGAPSTKEGNFSILSKRDQRTVRILSAIVRLVEELDREHLQRVSGIRLRRRGARVTLHLPAKLNLLVERIGAEERKEALEDALGVSIAVT